MLASVSIDSRASRPNKFSFFDRDKKDDDGSLGNLPFGNDNDKLLDKRIAILRHQRSISRDELIENLIKGALSITGMIFYYRLFSQIGDSLGNLGNSVMGALKLDSRSNDTGLHPNITRLLQPNATLNNFELEILQVTKKTLLFYLIAKEVIFSYCLFERVFYAASSTILGDMSGITTHSSVFLAFLSPAPRLLLILQCQHIPSKH